MTALLPWLALAAVCALATPRSARAQTGESANPVETVIASETETVGEAETATTGDAVEPTASAVTIEAEPPVGTWAVRALPPEPPPGPPRFWVAADLTFAQGLDFDIGFNARVGRLSLDARALVMPRFEVALRWALAYASAFGEGRGSRPADRIIAGNPGLALTYIHRLPAVDVRLGGELLVGLKQARHPEDEWHARFVLRASDGLQEGWRFAAGATTLVLEASLTSRGGPVRVGARAAYALFLGPAASFFVARQFGLIELGLRVGGGVIDLAFKHDGRLAFTRPASGDTDEGIAVTPYLRLERPGFFVEARVTCAAVRDLLWSTGVGAGANF